MVRRNAEGEDRPRRKNGRAKRRTRLAVDTLLRFAVPFVSGQCFQESQRPCLFAPFVASLCARRPRQLRLCYSALRTDPSGTSAPRSWPRRSSGKTPCPLQNVQEPFSRFLRPRTRGILEAFAFSLRKAKPQEDNLPKVTVSLGDSCRCAPGLLPLLFL